jgi:hypothetical protein
MYPPAMVMMLERINGRRFIHTAGHSPWNWWIWRWKLTLGAPGVCLRWRPGWTELGPVTSQYYRTLLPSRAATDLDQIGFGLNPHQIQWNWPNLNPTEIWATKSTRFRLIWQIVFSMEGNGVQMFRQSERL